MSKAMPQMDKEYQAECDLRTLIEAAKIRKDKARLAAALKQKKKAMTDMANIEDGKKEK